MKDFLQKNFSYIKKLQNLIIFQKFLKKWEKEVRDRHLLSQKHKKKRHCVCKERTNTTTNEK